jgi:hypothetical protein
VEKALSASSSNMEARTRPNPRHSSHHLTMTKKTITSLMPNKLRKWVRIFLKRRRRRKKANLIL